jgi:hypothetical protein
MPGPAAGHFAFVVLKRFAQRTGRRHAARVWSNSSLLGEVCLVGGKP